MTGTLPPSIQTTSQLEKIPLKAKQEIRVRVHVLKVVNINLAAQTFTVDVQFEASWVSQELKEYQNKEVKDVQRDGKTQIKSVANSVSLSKRGTKRNVSTRNSSTHG